MPFEFNNKLVVTRDELVPEYIPSERALQLRIQRYAELNYGIRAVQRGGNGRQLLIDFDSLDKDVQNAIGDPRKAKHLLENWYRTDAETVRFFSAYKFDDGSTLSLKHIEEYITNASVLAAAVQLKKAREFERKTKNYSMKGLMKSLCRDVQDFQETLKIKYGAQHSLPESEKRFKETFKAFLNGVENEFNYSSLISGKLKNQNSKKVTDDVLELLNNMFADDIAKPTRTEISRRFDAFLAGYVEVINEATGEAYDHAQYKPLSDATIINYLGKWEHRIGTYLKRSGDRQKYISKFIPYYSLKVDYAGEVLSVDDRQPPFKYMNATGDDDSSNGRPWFYLGVDVFSQAWTAWVYGKQKKGIIVEFYRQLIRNYAEWGFCLPAELECESNLNSSFKDTFLRNGAMFDNVHIISNMAQSKYVERMNGKMRYEEEKGEEGWLARPFARKEDNQSGHQKVPMIPYEHIQEVCLKHIENFNNKEHPKFPGKTRWEVFVENQHPGLKPTNWNAILPYMGYKTETSCNRGIIRLDNHEYFLGEDGEIKTGVSLVDLMKEVEGRQIDVYWLDGNDGKVIKALVMLRGGDRIICEAILKPIVSRSRVGRTPELIKNEAIVAAYVNTVTSYANDSMRNLEKVIVIDNRPTTLNKKFHIRDLKPRRADETEHTTEVLPEVQEEELVEATYQRHSSLKDRF